MCQLPLGPHCPWRTMWACYLAGTESKVGQLGSWQKSFGNRDLFPRNTGHTSVSKRATHVNDFPVSVLTVTSWPGRISLMLLDKSMVYLSWPVNPSVSASSPALKQSGIIPIPTKLLRWILSKLFAITALTPCLYYIIIKTTFQKLQG